MPWTVSKTARFEASHVLPAHDGKCARLHGHSWKVTVKARGDVLPSTGAKAGMVMDFADLSRPLKRLIEDHLDHYHLNDSTQLPNPTSEALAQWVYYRLAPQIPGLVSVKIEETCTSACTYTPRKEEIG